MIQISAWPIIWSILSAFLRVIPFADAYATEGGYVTIITLNLIIAVALLFSPFIVSQVCEGVNISVGEKLRGAVRVAALAATPKAAAIVSQTAKYANQKRQAYIHRPPKIRKVKGGFE